MIDNEVRFEERDERDPLGDLFGIFISERSGSERMKLHSELTWKPSIDVVEMEKEIVILVDIAGMDSKDINVVTDGKILKISGSRQNISPPGKKQFHQLEIQVGPFERVIELPVPVDHSKVTACYNNGLLRVRVRKLGPTKRIRKVQID